MGYVLKWWNEEDDFTESTMWQQLKFNDFLNSLWEERKTCCILSKMSLRSKIREVNSEIPNLSPGIQRVFKLHVAPQSFSPFPVPPPPQLCIILFSFLGFTTVWPRVVFFLNDNESNWKYWLAVQLSCQHNHLICQEDLLNCQKSYKKNSFSQWWYTLEMFTNQMGHFWDKCWRKFLKWVSQDFF